MTANQSSSTQKNRQLYYDANSDTVRSRILTDTGQELVQYRKGSAVRIWYNDLFADFEPHWHSALEIIVPIDNWYDILIGETTYHSVPGDIMLIPPRELHALKAPESGSRFIYLFDVSFFFGLQGFAGIQPILSDPLHLTRNSCPGIYDEACRILALIREEYFSGNEFSTLSIYSLLLDLFVKIARDHIDSIRLFPHTAMKQHDYADRFNAVLDYIDSHYTENLQLADIADAAGFSKYHFSRLFKQYTNYTPGAYICRRRIKAAEELLEQQNLSVTEAAMKSGFPSISTFNRLFKKYKGCCPSEYREKHQLHPL